MGDKCPGSEPASRAALIRCRWIGRWIGRWIDCPAASQGACGPSEPSRRRLAGPRRRDLKNGIVTRAILIDIPRLKNLAYLEPGTPVFQEDLDAWEKRAGVKVSSGDAIFLRTGRWARREKLGPWNIAQNAAGVHASVAPWIKARGVAFIGSDAALDVTPSLVDGNNLPVHTLMINALGIKLLDNQDLEAVGDMAAKLNRWEFLLTVAPVPVTGGTGFPVNALATF
jgi:kynurenine formamidase